MDNELLVQSLINAKKEENIKSIICCNEISKKFGLILSEKDAEELLISRKEALIEEGRIEFNGGILEKLIYEFCDFNDFYSFIIISKYFIIVINIFIVYFIDCFLFIKVVFFFYFCHFVSVAIK